MKVYVKHKNEKMSINPELRKKRSKKKKNGRGKQRKFEKQPKAQIFELYR